MAAPDRVAATREALDCLYEISNILNTGLDRETLSICVSLTEAGVNPEALAAVIKELKREGDAIKAAEDSGPTFMPATSS